MGTQSSNRRAASGAALAAVVLASGCGDRPTIPTPAPVPAPAEAGGSRRADDLSRRDAGGARDAGVTAAPLPPTGDSTFSAADLYARTSPAVAFVETPLATGSALAIAPGRLLTNAHVVWPFEQARVVFPDHASYDDVPVTHVDLLGDLAVLDLGAAAGATARPGGAGDGAPLALSDPAGLPIGSEVYLVGYPAETEALPVPAITRGLLSRRRRWDALAMTFLQTDAALAGGQSGGALLAADGTAIGLSGMLFGDAAFGLAAAMPDVMGRVARMARGEDVDGIAPRSLPRGGGLQVQRSEPAHFWDEAVYVVLAPVGTTVQLTATAGAGGDASLSVIDPYGDIVLDADDEAAGNGDAAGGRDTGRDEGGVAWVQDPVDNGEVDSAAGDDETGVFEIQVEGPYFVAAGLDARGTLAVRASVPLATLDDPDDGRSLAAGGTVAGSLDFPGDTDFFDLELRAGQAVTITVETINFGPELILDHAGDPGLAPPAGDAQVPSALGLAARAAFTSPVDTTYLVVVRDAEGAGTGGYLLGCVTMPGADPPGRAP